MPSQKRRRFLNAQRRKRTQKRRAISKESFGNAENLRRIFWILENRRLQRKPLTPAEVELFKKELRGAVAGFESFQLKFLGRERLFSPNLGRSRLGSKIKIDAIRHVPKGFAGYIWAELHRMKEEGLLADDSLIEMMSSTINKKVKK